MKIILKYLMDSTTIPIKDIGRKMNISEKTVRTKVSELELYLEKQQLGTINKIQGKGISLEVTKEQKRRILEIISRDTSLESFSTDLESTVIFHLLQLSSNKTITQSHLAAQVFVSVPTLSKLLKQINPWLLKRKLKLTSTQKKGLSISGTEYDKRIAIKDFILTRNGSDIEGMLERFTRGLELKPIQGSIYQTERDWKVKFTKESFNLIWIMISLSFSRDKNSIQISESVIQEIKLYNEYSFAQSIYSNLEALGYRKSHLNNSVILALEILGASKIEWACSKGKKRTDFDQKLISFIEQLISTISAVLEEDLTKDTLLKEHLLQHMYAAIFRMRYGQKNLTSLSKQIKEQYSRVFLSTWSTSQLFDDYFGVQVTEHELSYIALYIETALMRKKNIVKAIFVTDQTLSQSFFTTELLKQHIGQLEGINIVRKHDFEAKQHLYHRSLIITNVELKCEVKPTYYVSCFPDESEITQIRMAVSQLTKARKAGQPIFSNEIQVLFDPDLIFLNLKIKNKEELLQIMVNKLEQKGNVKPGFLETVKKREQATTTCIGNSIAIPHGSMNEVNEAKIMIGILNQSIEWFPGEKIDLIFLLSMKGETETEIKRVKLFYQDLIKFSEARHLIDRFKLMQSSVEAYQFLFN